MKELNMFGMRIKELRVGRKLSQEQLAPKVGISPKYLSRIEMGRHFPSFAVLVNLAKVLDVELKDFCEYDHVKLSASELRKRLNKMIINTDEEKLRILFKMFKSITR